MNIVHIIVSVLERPLIITRNLTEKQIIYTLKGYMVAPRKPTKQARLNLIDGNKKHIDHKDYVLFNILILWQHLGFLVIQ